MTGSRWSGCALLLVCLCHEVVAGIPPDEAVFLKTMELVKQKKVDAAQQNLDRFVKRFPSSPLVPQALVVNAGLFKDQQNHWEAELRLQKVLGGKLSVHAPDALLEMVRLKDATNEPKETHKYLLQLWSLFPFSRAAKIAAKEYAAEFKKLNTEAFKL